jgi:hypothetical protein
LTQLLPAAGVRIFSPLPVAIDLVLPQPMLVLSRSLTPSPQQIVLNFPTPGLVTSGMAIAVGTYTGNEVSGRLIPTSFPPVLTYVGNMSGNKDEIRLIFRHRDYPDGLSNQVAVNGGIETDGILRFEHGGFVVGAGDRVNHAGHVYQYLAIGNGLDLVLGMYVGNGAVYRPVTDLGLAPDFAQVQNGSVQFSFAPVWRSNTIAPPAYSGSYRLINGEPGDVHIKSLDANGFTVGEAFTVNQAGVPYYYYAVKNGDRFRCGAYPGDGVDGRAIPLINTALGWTFVKKRTPLEATVRLMYRSSGSGAADESRDCFEEGPIANVVQGFSQEGFSVGTHDRVNALDNDYDWFSWGDLALPARTFTPDPVVIQMAFPAAALSKVLTLTPGPVVIQIILPEGEVLCPRIFIPDPVVLAIELPEAVLRSLLTLTAEPVTLALRLPAGMLRRRGRVAVGDVRLGVGGVVIGDVKLTVGEATAEDLRALNGNARVEDE